MMAQSPRKVASLTVEGTVCGHVLHTALSTSPLASVGHEEHMGGGGHTDLAKVTHSVKVIIKVKVSCRVAIAKLGFD
jgi:hypothetical protein